MRTPNYDKLPTISVPTEFAQACWTGWPAIIATLRARPGAVLAVECYPGVHTDELRDHLVAGLRPSLTIETREVFKSPCEIDTLVAADLGGDDPIFGRLSHLRIEDFLDDAKLAASRDKISVAKGFILVVGPSATLVAPESAVLVYADMPRWEGQLRQRRGEVDNLGVRNRGLKASLQYKRSFFIDWRVADQLKRRTMSRWDFLLDTTTPASPKLITGAAHLATLAQAARRPFRVVPFFDPGPWGGQWMRKTCDLPDGPANYAWCFDCVPEENSLLLAFGDGTQVEIPSLNLVFNQPVALLGEPVYGRFGAEFPIRFDFLDTMDGGNLSFQVHPTTEYAREHFSLGYTQDESYYLLDAAPGAEVFLGCKNGTDSNAMIADLEAAQRGEKAFDDARFAALFPAQKHDHFLIPAGTLHCAGAGAMVLEISATPYIFTFKLWDWNRLGIDGLPRPVNIPRGREVIDWTRDEDYARARLINQVTAIAQGDGWREERTGLHEAEFIETRRHWFTGKVTHRRTGSVEVLNLVEGEAALVESVDGAWAPFEVHYAETFILPAAAGDYTVRPLGASGSEPHATLKAYVRHHA
jgi:mannose-6-phosphate isomerase class I